MKAAVTAVAVAAVIASPGTSADLPQEEPLVTREDLEENVVKYTPEAERVEAVLDTAEKVEHDRELAEWKKESEQYVKERDARLERERKEREQRERERLEQLERERQAELERKRLAKEREEQLEQERLAYERKWEEKEARETQRETTSQPVANSTQQTGQQTEQQMTQPTGQTRQFQVTAYVATGNPTASGVMPTVGRTVACPPEIPFGTRIHIEGVGDRICEDRGGAIHGNVLDLFVGSQEEAIAWGRRVLNVTIY